MNQKLIFIGGHHNSALVVAKIFKTRGWQIFWFGHKHTISQEKSLSLEWREVSKAGIPFFELKTGKFYRTANPLKFLKIIYGFIQALIYLLKIRPKAIISFGGYLSVPVILAGKLLRISCFIQEQTSRAGLANRLVAPLANKIYLAWPQSQKFFPGFKVKNIGLALEAKLLAPGKVSSPFKEKLPIILVTGGKQGSHLINKVIEEKLTAYLKEFNLIHQTGALEKTNDFQRLSTLRKTLPQKLQIRYLVKNFFYSSQMAQLLKLADVVISRSGAHITYELAALGKPAILIPLPWAYNNEQLANAQILARAGLAIILPQSELKAQTLWEKTKYLASHQQEFAFRATALQKMIKTDAASTMVKDLEQLLK